jgi:hypothetical protein
VEVSLFCGGYRRSRRGFGYSSSALQPLPYLNNQNCPRDVTCFQKIFQYLFYLRRNLCSVSIKKLKKKIADLIVDRLSPHSGKSEVVFHNLKPVGSWHLLFQYVCPIAALIFLMHSLTL